MATGENFMRICWARKKSLTMKNPEVKAEIERLQKINSELWANDNLSDEYVEQESKKISAQIYKLIDEAEYVEDRR